MTSWYLFGGKKWHLAMPDAETAANRGYAFLNFLDPGSAWMSDSEKWKEKLHQLIGAMNLSVASTSYQTFAVLLLLPLLLLLVVVLWWWWWWWCVNQFSRAEGIMGHEKLLADSHHHDGFFFGHTLPQEHLQYFTSHVTFCCSLLFAANVMRYPSPPELA